MEADHASPEHLARARSFGDVAEVYDRARPSYPRDAVAWLTGDTPARVLELGAGTGKLTELATAAGHRVLATDPSQPMLRMLVRRSPSARAVLARAEAIPVRSRTVDVVLAGQAFHWFDTAATLPEVARVLRPGGVLALVWNARDERVPWVRRLGELIGVSPGEAHPSEPLAGSDLFEPAQVRQFRFWQPVSRESLVDLAATRSNVAVMDPTQRQEVLAGVGRLYDDYGRGPDGMLLPYVTTGFRARLKAPGQTPDSRQAPPVGEDLLVDFD